MIGVLDAPSDSVAFARRSLSDACTELDAAVMSLSEEDADETVMANPALVGLLLRVVAARRYLAVVERRPEAGWPATLL